MVLAGLRGRLICPPRTQPTRASSIGIDLRSTSCEAASFRPRQSTASAFHAYRSCACGATGASDLTMFLPIIDGAGPLLQGDLCRAVPLPILTADDSTTLMDLSAEVALGSPVPSTGDLSTRSRLGAILRLVERNVLVLSQSCDLEDAEKDTNARVLVALVLADDDGRFAEQHAAAVEKDLSDFVKGAAKLAKNPGNATKALEKSAATMESRRAKALEDLWLGNVEGAFPVAASPSHSIKRSVCYFDTVVSLPSAWIPLLRDRRVQHLAPPWAAVLQESLARWLGRYAFPGTKAERLASSHVPPEP